MVSIMTRMEKVFFLDDFILEVELTDGRSCIYDMKPKLKTVRFHDLEDEGIFSDGRIKNGQVICWSNGIELSLHEIMMNPVNR